MSSKIRAIVAWSWLGACVVASLTICPDQSQCPAGDTCCPTFKGYGCCPASSGVCCGSEGTCCPSDFICYAGNNTCTASDPSKHVYDPWHPRWNLCHGPIPLKFLPDVVNQQNMPYYSNNGDLTKPDNNDIEMAVIVVHGAGRNADEYFCAMKEAAALQEYYEPEDVMVIAPWFMEPQDNPASGQQSLPDSQGASISSYAILDLMLTILNTTKIYPKLRTVSVVGHSSGGQTIQRYALTQHLTPILNQSTFHPRFVVINPSSYAYFDQRRWIDDVLQVPNASTQASCPEFNAWEWGVDGNFPRYLAQGGDPATWVQAYADKDIRYMVGENDTCNSAFEPGCVSHGLEVTCMDNLEGWMRRYRAEHYFQYLQVFFDRAVHQLTVIPNSGHDHTLMFQHPDGLAVIFEPGEDSRVSSNRTLGFVLFSCLLVVGVLILVAYYRMKGPVISAEPSSYKQLLAQAADSDEDWMEDEGG